MRRTNEFDGRDFFIEAAVRAGVMPKYRASCPSLDAFANASGYRQSSRETPSRSEASAAQRKSPAFAGLFRIA